LVFSRAANFALFENSLDGAVGAPALMASATRHELYLSPMLQASFGSNKSDKHLKRAFAALAEALQLGGANE
jgi:hypothetical protein